MTDADRQALQPGDRVVIRRDDGSEEEHVVEWGPGENCGHEWVIGLVGWSGWWSLDRVVRRIESSSPKVCAICRVQPVPPDRSVCFSCVSESLDRGVAWWQRVAEAKQEERDAALDQMQSWKNIADRQLARIAELEARVQTLTEQLTVAVELCEDNQEFIQIGTDSWVWLQIAREILANDHTRT